jgi:hypothetical protein
MSTIQQLLLCMEHGRPGREVTWAVVIIKAVRQREQVANKASEGASWLCGKVGDLLRQVCLQARCGAWSDSHTLLGPT